MLSIIKDMDKNLQIKNCVGKFLAMLFFVFFLSMNGNLRASENDASILLAQMIKEKKVTLNFKNRPINEVLTAIQSKTGIDFGYTERVVLAQVPAITVAVKDMSVDQALALLLRETGYEYKVVADRIIIDKKQSNVQIQNNLAEKITVKGRVLSESKEPVVGATILVLGTTNGAISDDKGGFTLTCPKGSKVEISFVGMVTKIVTFTENSQNFVVQMEKDAMQVDDVVITGLFARKKSGFAGTTNVITKADLKKVSTGNIFTTISTLDAGFKINENNMDGSNPNRLPDFTIRGKGSFQNGSTAPIFILDGFEVSSQKVFDMDINRIESLTLLKDASATILYGSRASNGVIVIETTAPKAGQLRVSYDFKPTIGIVDLSDYDLMNAREKLQYEQLAGLYESENASDQKTLERLYYSRYANLLEGVDTYWLSQPVRNSFSHAHSLFIEGGVDNVRYGIDVGYNKNNGVLKESGRDRLNLGFSLIYRIKDKVTIKNNITYAHVKAYDSPYGTYSAYGKLNPYEKPRNERGELVPILSDKKPNPLYDAELPNRSGSKDQEFREQLSIDWNIITGLRLRGQLGITKINGNSDQYRSPFSSDYVLTTTYNSETMQTEYMPVEHRGELSKGNNEGLNISTNLTLDYNLNIKKHIIYFGVGAELNSDETNSYGFIMTGFADDRYSDPAFAIQYKADSRPTSDESAARSVGMFGNVNYIFDDRFFADFSFRYDGSSKFGAANRFAPFWSIGAGWNIHNEKFFNKKSVDMFKLRYSYGVTGNQEFSSYQAKTSYQFNTDRTYDSMITSSLMGYGNPNLKWQNQYQHNIGLDLGFIQSRLRISFNYYNKLTEGMLTDITVAPSVGIADNKYKANLGEIKNRGYEVNVNAVILRKPAQDLEWSAYFQGANNKNTLVKISNELKGINAINNEDKLKPQFVYEEGQSMSALKAVRSLGINPANGQEIYLNKDGQITYVWDANDKVLCGDTEPVFFGNFGTNLFFKGWNLNLSFRYRTGADYYNETLSARVEGADPNYNADRRVLSGRWQEVGVPALYKNIKDYKSTYISSRFIQKENLIEAGSMSISYEFSRKHLEKLKLSTLRLSFYANDLLRFSTIKQERGLDYPFQRSFVFGLNVSF